MSNPNYPPIRSPQYDTPRGGKLLTDSAITRYIALGFYGERRRLALLAKQKSDKQAKLARTTKQKGRKQKDSVSLAIQFIQDRLSNDTL